MDHSSSPLELVDGTLAATSAYAKMVELSDILYLMLVAPDWHSLAGRIVVLLSPSLESSFGAHMPQVFRRDFLELEMASRACLNGGLC
jgi:hypothetical protein